MITVLQTYDTYEIPSVLGPCKFCGTSAASGLKFGIVYVYKARLKALNASKVGRTF